MKSARLIYCAAALSLATIQNSHSIRAEVEPFVVAAVELQGDALTLLPLATVDRSTWRNSWPPPTESQIVPRLEDIPASWLGKRIPTTWTVWSDSRVVGKVRVLGTTRMQTGCTAPVALRVSSLQPAIPEQKTLFAVDTEQRIEGFLTPTGPERRRLEEAIRVAFVAAESRIVDSSDEEREVSSAIALSRPPITVRALFRSASKAAPVIYHFEAVRRGSNSRGPLGVVVDGWAVQSGTVMSPYGVSARHFRGYDDPDAAEGPVLSPIGLLRLNGHVFWISRWQGYEDYSYLVDRVERDAVERILTVFAGGC